MERHRRIVDLNLSKGKVNPVPICLFHILLHNWNFPKQYGHCRVGSTVMMCSCSHLNIALLTKYSHYH